MDIKLGYNKSKIKSIKFYEDGNIKKEKYYDNKGNEIHYKDSNGYEEWKEYDNKGGVI